MAALTAAGRTPGLGTVLVGDDPGSQAYVRGKHADCAKVGITSIRRDLPADISQATLDETIDELNANPECTGYIVQLPLPKHLDENAALERIDPAKDADGLHPTNLGTAGAQRARAAAVHPARHRAPAAAVRRADRRRARRGDRARRDGRAADGAAADPTVRERHGHVVPHRNSRPARPRPGRPTSSSPRSGVPHMVTADMVKPGAAVVDVGVSRDEAGKLVGDVHPDVWDVAGHVSPNPGGVGPLTRAFLLTNVVELEEAKR